MKRLLIWTVLSFCLWLSACAIEDSDDHTRQTGITAQEVNMVPEDTPNIKSTEMDTPQIQPTTCLDLGTVVNEGYGDYLFVPAGQFSMGDNFDEGSIDDGTPREKPVRNIYLDAYYIGRFEITNAEYSRFLADGGYKNEEYWSRGGFNMFSQPEFWNEATFNGGGLPDNESFPVVGVSWFEAAAYCSWLSAKTGSIYRLPTEAEWEKAARGGDYLDGDERRQVPNPIPQRRYPWGNEIDGSFANYLDSGDPYDNDLTPVGYYDGSLRGDFQTNNNASPYGAYDMAGNVYEWINDYFGRYDEAAITNPQGPRSASGHVIRGSAFLYETFKQRSAYRGAYYPSFRGEYIGIRCVREFHADYAGE